MWALVGISLFVITTLLKSRHVRILGALGEEPSTAGGDGSSKLDNAEPTTRSTAEGVGDSKRGMMPVLVSIDGAADDPERGSVPGAGSVSEGVGRWNKASPTGSISEGVDDAKIVTPPPTTSRSTSKDLDNSASGTAPIAGNIPGGVDYWKETLPMGSISEGVDGLEPGRAPSVDGFPDVVDRIASVSEFSERGTE